MFCLSLLIVTSVSAQSQDDDDESDEERKRTKLVIFSDNKYSSAMAERPAKLRVFD